MNEVLSNTEIEALLDVFRADQSFADGPREEDLSMFVGGDDAAHSPVVSRLDLFKPNRLSREQLASLECSGENAARAIGATTSDKLRLEVACDCVAVEQLRFGTWLNQLSDRVAIYVVKLPPLEQTALVSVSTALLYSSVDRILGGSGRVHEAPIELTSAEYTVADAFVGPCLDHICRSLNALGDLSWEIQDRLANPSSAQILGAHEVAVSVYFQISGEIMQGDLRLVLPYAMLEPHLDRLVRSRVGAFSLEPGQMRATVATSVGQVGVEMRVELGRAALTISDLLALEVGDVVPLDTKPSMELIAPVQGVPKFRGVVGTQGRRLAYRISSMID